MFDSHSVDFLGMREVVFLDRAEHGECGIFDSSFGGSIESLFEFAMDETL